MNNRLPHLLRASALACAALVGCTTTTSPAPVERAEPAYISLVPGEDYLIPGSGYALLCVSDESEYECGKRIVLELPGGKPGPELASGPRSFYASWGAGVEADTFALVHGPVSKESTLTLYRADGDGVQTLWRSPECANERVQWSVKRWERGRVLVERFGEDTGTSEIVVQLRD